ncbi:hypothetical protein [Nonomuraea sp. NPDC005650]|uniref:hypothetical protein n=1 Tax=Nonomuraea sp. NPDC005650 TaxID=3157045 RepID=UPI00339E8F43
MTTERWALGGDLSVARIGYGAMKLTGWPRGERPARETAPSPAHLEENIAADELRLTPEDLSDLG